jgi:hypothetical protein
VAQMISEPVSVGCVVFVLSVIAVLLGCLWCG